MWSNHCGKRPWKPVILKQDVPISTIFFDIVENNFSFFHIFPLLTFAAFDCLVVLAILGVGRGCVPC